MAKRAALLHSGHTVGGEGRAGELYYECRDCGGYRDPVRTDLPILWFWDSKPK